MTSMFARFIETFIRLLPATIARTLLVLVTVGALGLHIWAMERIRSLEVADTDRRVEAAELRAQNAHVLAAVKELAEEIRGYREDIRDENKALRGARR